MRILTAHTATPFSDTHFGKLGALRHATDRQARLNFVINKSVLKMKKDIQQAGGARVDWNEGTSPAGVRGSESSSRALILAAEIECGAGAGYAHWHIVTPRQQP